MSYTQETQKTLDEIARQTGFEPTPSARRIKILARMARLPMGLGQIHIDGAPNLAKSAPLKELVVATSHITDMDPWIGGEMVGRVRLGRIAAGAMSTNFEDQNKWGYKLAGEGFVHPIPYATTASGEKVPKKFDTNDYDSMLKAINDGSAMVVAAHNPPQHSKRNRQYIGTIPPDQPGLLAPYLALESDAPILPVTVNIEGQSSFPGQFTNQQKDSAFLRKTDVVARFGEAIDLDRENWLDAKTGQDRSAEKKQFQILHKYGNRVLDAVRELSQPF